jgi:hypothetical protein
LPANRREGEEWLAAETVGCLPDEEIEHRMFVDVFDEDKDTPSNNRVVPHIYFEK